MMQLDRLTLGRMAKELGFVRDALDSFVYEYVNCGGVKDNLKIEINYMLRCHVLPVASRTGKLP